MSTIRLGFPFGSTTQAERLAARIEKSTESAPELIEVAGPAVAGPDVTAPDVAGAAALEAARAELIAGRVDLLLYPLAGVAAAEVAGLRLAAILKRSEPRDALVSRDRQSLEQLAPGSKVGADSALRRAQLLFFRPELEVSVSSGSLEAKLEAVSSGAVDAVVVSAAELAALGRLEEAGEVFELSDHPTTAAQGAFAVDAGLKPSREVQAALKGLDQSSTRLMVHAERAVADGLGLGDDAPLGCSAIVDGDLLLLSATVYRRDGSEHLTSSHGLVLEGPPPAREVQAAELGERVAEELRELGASALAAV